MSRRRAVTLVELVLTIAIVAVLAGVGIGGLVGVQTWRAHSAVRRVHADVSYARARAMLTTRRTLCTFDTAAQQYELGQEPLPATGRIVAQPLVHPLDDQMWRVSLAELGGGLSITGLSGLAGAALGFDANGQPVRPSGQPLTRDVWIRFSNGAQLIVRAGSGLCEVVWP